MNIPEIPESPLKKQKSQLNMIKILALQSEIVEQIWVNLNDVERKVYEQIIDDARNQNILNIITIAVGVGMNMEFNRLKSEMQIINEESKKIIKLNNRVVSVMSGLILGLSAMILMLLILLFIL